MNAKRTAPALLVMAIAAYAAGRLGPVAGEESRAWGRMQQEPPPAGATPADVIQAWREAATPGPRHGILDPLVGEWTTEFQIRVDADAPPLVARGILRRHWILGGRFLEETIEDEADGEPFRGVGYVGYSNLDGHYEMVWMDTLSTALYIETGTYHPDTKILHTRGSQRDPATGHVIHTWTKLDMSDPDRHTLVGHATGADGRVYKAFEGVLERRR